MIISAASTDYQTMNKLVRECNDDVSINDCFGERFIASGESNKTITINGTPGNALGAYLDGATVIVNGNGQDAVGDTMNDGEIVINGNAGDALGYAMRGGSIYVRGNAGYRTGIHMKEYEEKKPVIVVGGAVGSFTGEYLAGGVIIVLGLGMSSVPLGNFTGTGMHGGRIYIRSEKQPENLPPQVSMHRAEDWELKDIENYIEKFCGLFGEEKKAIMSADFYVLAPNAKNPYRQLYTVN